MDLIKIQKLPRYGEFVERKKNHYKKNGQRIWKIQYDYLLRTHNSERKSFIKKWYEICLWELKFYPKLKDRVNNYKKKIKNRIQNYSMILDKIAMHKTIDLNLYIYIIQFIF